MAIASFRYGNSIRKMTPGTKSQLDTKLKVLISPYHYQAVSHRAVQIKMRERIPYYRGLHLLLDMMTKNDAAVPGCLSNTKKKIEFISSINTHELKFMSMKEIYNMVVTRFYNDPQSIYNSTKI